MSLFYLFVGVMLAAATWHVVTILLIYGALQKRGVPVSFLWLRALAPKYASQYKKITSQENGKVGPLFYHWLISINTALVAALAALLLQFA